jgi:hypothetical protein
VAGGRRRGAHSPGDLALSHVAALYDGEGPLAYPGYRSPALAAGFARVRAATDQPALVAEWRAIQRELAQAEPTVWIYHARGVQGKARRIENVRVDLRGELAGIAAWRIGSGGRAAERQSGSNRPTAQPPNRRGRVAGGGP